MSDKPAGPAYHLHMAAPTIHLSFDQDWAPAWTSLALGDALAAAGVNATLFVTHPCSSLERLREDGWEKVISGVTTVDEVLRVTKMD